MKTLLITPPLLQPNTPYAATPILTAWLRSRGQEAVQADLSLELLLKLFSADSLAHLNLKKAYAAVIGDVMEFLQDKNPALAKRFAKRGALPEGIHLARAYEQEEQFGWDFRGLDRHDRARHLCSLFLDDIAEAAALLDPHFGFSRYAEKLAAALPDFGKIQEALNAKAGRMPTIRTAGILPASLFLHWL
ncbi:MAG: hypothetical protein WC334_07495, partial [Kiritimatiellales bacterium]